MKRNFETLIAFLNFETLTMNFETLTMNQRWLKKHKTKKERKQKKKKERKRRNLPVEGTSLSILIRTVSMSLNSILSPQQSSRCPYSLEK